MVKFQSEYGLCELDRGMVVLDANNELRWASDIMLGELAYSLVTGCFGFRVL